MDKLRLPLGAVVLALLLVVSACTKSGESAGTANSSSVDPEKVYVEGVPSLNEVMEGSVGDPPSTGPKAAPGKRVWFISCGQSLPTCALLGDAAKRAADILGWDLQIGDGKLNPTGYADAIATAIAQKPDGVIIGGIACGNIKQSLVNAKQAGIPVIGIKSPDCDEPPTNGEKLFTESMYYVGTNEQANYEATIMRGRHAAQYLINITQGKAKVIYERGNDPVIEPINQGFEEELVKCEECEIVKTIDYVPTDQGPDGALAQGLQAALVQTPEANALYAPYDASLILSRGAQIVAQSGRDIAIIAADGSPDGLDLVRNGQVAVETAGQSYEWYGFAVMDSMNRILAGEPVIDEGLGWQPVDQNHNLPDEPGTPVEAPFDVAATYTKIWKG